MEHFWTPPAGQTVLGMIRYEDMIIVACTDGLWVMAPEGRTIDNFTVHKINSEFRQRLP